MSFSPNGKLLLAGHVNGSCIIYESDSLPNLKRVSRIDCKNRAGKYSLGRKISGITFINNTEFLVATNDSSVRLY